jgi:hypothetical protein
MDMPLRSTLGFAALAIAALLPGACQRQATPGAGSTQATSAPTAAT